MSKTLGILGVGQLAHYCISGLRHGNDKRTITLSPRGKEMSKTIAEKFNCTIATDNQQVVDQSDIILLATRPDDAIAALNSVQFEGRHIVISVVAGAKIGALRPHVGQAKLVRSLPVFSAEVCAGGMPLFPDNTEALDLLSTLGDVIVLPTEAQFETASVMGCTFSWFFRIYGELQSWLENADIPAEQARALALQCAHGVSSLALAKPEMNLHEMASEIARPGTFSLAGEQELKEKGGLEALTAACDLVHEKLLSNN